MKLPAKLKSLTALILFSTLFVNFITVEDLDFILRKSLEASNTIENGYYSASFHDQSSGSDEIQVIDTILVNFDKIEGDTLNGKLSIYMPSFSIEYLYDTKNIYFFNHKDKKLRSVDVSKHGVGHITGNIISEVLFKDYLDPDFTQTDRIERANSIVLANDTIVQNKDCYTIKYLFKDDTLYNVTHKVGKLYIEKSSYLPVGFFSEYRYNGLYAFSKFEIIDYDFNKDKYKKHFEEINSYDDYKKEVYEEPILDRGLEVGAQVALDFPLEYFDNNEPVNFNEDDQLILLDYWYMACPPCTKAAPYVNEIYQKYNSKGLMVLGINPIDKNKEKLNTFFENKKIDYPVCLDKEKVTVDTFGVFAYPTFILLDKDGTILHRIDGFEASLMEELTNKIDGLLN